MAIGNSYDGVDYPVVVTKVTNGTPGVVENLNKPHSDLDIRTSILKNHANDLEQKLSIHNAPGPSHGGRLLLGTLDTTSVKNKELLASTWIEPCTSNTTSYLALLHNSVMSIYLDRRTQQFLGVGDLRGVAYNYESSAPLRIVGHQAAHGFVLLTPIRWNMTSWVVATEMSDMVYKTDMVVTKVLDANTFEMGQYGKVSYPGHGYSVGTTYYVSADSNTPETYVDDPGDIHPTPSSFRFIIHPAFIPCGPDEIILDITNPKDPSTLSSIEDLDTLSDVTTSSTTQYDTLVYNHVTSKWVNHPAPWAATTTNHIADNGKHLLPDDITNIRNTGPGVGSMMTAHTVPTGSRYIRCSGAGIVAAPVGVYPVYPELVSAIGYTGIIIQGAQADRKIEDILSTGTPPEYTTIPSVPGIGSTVCIGYPLLSKDGSTSVLFWDDFKKVTITRDISGVATTFNFTLATEDSDNPRALVSAVSNDGTIIAWGGGATLKYDSNSQTYTSIASPGFAQGSAQEWTQMGMFSNGERIIGLSTFGATQEAWLGTYNSGAWAYAPINLVAPPGESLTGVGACRMRVALSSFGTFSSYIPIIAAPPQDEDVYLQLYTYNGGTSSWDLQSQEHILAAADGAGQGQWARFDNWDYSENRGLIHSLYKAYILKVDVITYQVTKTEVVPPFAAQGYYFYDDNIQSIITISEDYSWMLAYIKYQTSNGQFKFIALDSEGVSLGASDLIPMLGDYNFGHTSSSYVNAWQNTAVITDSGAPTVTIVKCSGVSDRNTFVAKHSTYVKYTKLPAVPMDSYGNYTYIKT